MLHAVKFAPGSEVIIEGFGMPFGGPFNGRDLHGEYFWRGTDFALDLFPDGARPVMYDHGMDKTIGVKAVGRVLSAEPMDAGIWTRSQLDRHFERLSEIQTLIDAGALGFSSGAPPHLVAVDHKSGRIDRWPFVEQTLTPIPANPDGVPVYALKSAELLSHLTEAGFDDPAGIVERVETALKMALGVHHTGTTAMDAAWDGPANEARLPSEEGPLRAAHAWFESGADPAAKSSYRFIHHDVSADGSVGDANMRACSTGVGVLNGGRGGTTIPDSDVAGVWRHLAAHMRDGDMTPPELKSASLGRLTYADHLDRVIGEATGLMARSEEIATMRAEARGIKEGRVLSSSNRERLARLLEQMRNVAADVDELLAATEPNPAKAAPDLDNIYLRMLARNAGIDV
jgi:hypothetical protein